MANGRTKRGTSLILSWINGKPGGTDDCRTPSRTAANICPAPLTKLSGAAAAPKGGRELARRGVRAGGEGGGERMATVSPRRGRRLPSEDERSRGGGKGASARALFSYRPGSP
ncbi:hypothetical protein GWI33_006579 [Rhynchophorus ferrugineus]|uniref:Uncharacterized protein n=1 Tax=Rhynchophorus ferrugineus TaxID=354439 RepID=A0A834IKY9_RHYFE|nr:hypothetical protein GWI33_006579 [Rhynchophorus ferrugineus]